MKNKKMKLLRNGDVILYPITQEEFNKAKGELIENKGSLVLAYGETTGHKHLLTAERMEIKKAEDGRFYLAVQSEGKLSHEEHGTLVVGPQTFYKQLQEKEMDWFSKSVRLVID